MLFTPIKEQCCVKHMITRRIRESDCVTPTKVRAILGGKNFFEYESYEVMFQASIFMPFLIIFITQIIIKYIGFIEKNMNSQFFLFSTVAFFIAFIAFLYIIYEIIEARHNKEYKIVHLSVALIIFLFISTIALYIGSEGKFTFNWLWAIIPVILVIATLFFINNQRHFECNIEAKQILLAVFSFVVLIIIVISIFNYSFYNTLLIFPTVLFAFYFINIYLHNELLKLIQENDNQIDDFRTLQEGIERPGGNGYYDSIEDF